jgi:glycosyltransferase involved in cell wall biosynthesis
VTAPRLYYLDDIPTPYRLGVQRRIAALWPGAFRLGYCAAEEPGRDWTLDLSGLDVEILPGRQFRPKRQVNPFSFKWNPSVFSALQKFAPDVVVLSGYVHPTMLAAAAWCIARKIPYGVVSETSARSTVQTGLRWTLKKVLCGWVVRNMAFGLPVGREAAAHLRALGASAPAYYFPNTPDVSIIAERAEAVKMTGADRTIRSDLGVAPDHAIVLFVGRMIDAKLPMDALTAFRTANRDKSALVFVGDGPLLDDLRKAAEGDSRVIFTGWLKDPGQVASLMAASAIMVLPSQHETWGAVVNESMAAGVPVVASDRVGAAAELIDTGVNGVIYPVGDVAKLSEALGGLLDDPQGRRAMGEAARATALANGHGFAADNFVAGCYFALNRSISDGSEPG